MSRRLGELGQSDDDEGTTYFVFGPSCDWAFSRCGVFGPHIYLGLVCVKLGHCAGQEHIYKRRTGKL